MKLRNRKTGEIGYTAVLQSKAIVVMDENAIQLGSYTSLTELNSEWEDAPEEPKEYWFINDLDGEPMKCELRYCPVRDFDDWSEKRKKTGNYFETKEEAELAVRKLKAWKRLRDKGFRFDPVDRYEALCGNGFNIPITATMPPEAYTDAEVSKDLDICFGGEE